jgi:CRP/FNR family transcriptional regulator, cyclic AMP receptor protein
MVVRPLGAVKPLPLVVVRIGQTPLRQGQACAAVWRIDSGLLSLDVVDADGRSFLVDLVGPGDTLGVPEGAVAPWTATAWRPTRLMELTGDEAAAAIAAQTTRAVWIAAGLAWFGVAERIRRRLTDLAERLGRPVPGGVQLPCALTQEELASMVGATRESVNRATMSMIRDGTIDVRGRGRYVVRTPLRLVDGCG